MYEYTYALNYHVFAYKFVYSHIEYMCYMLLERISVWMHALANPCYYSVLPVTVHLHTSLINVDYLVPVIIKVFKLFSRYYGNYINDN